jgi:hypothetical protein
MNIQNYRDLGCVGRTMEKASYIRNLLTKDYPFAEFFAAKNDYNDGFDIYTTFPKNDENDISAEIKISEFRGFMRGVIVEKDWLEPK